MTYKRYSLAPDQPLPLWAKEILSEMRAARDTARKHISNGSPRASRDYTCQWDIDLCGSRQNSDWGE